MLIKRVRKFRKEKGRAEYPRLQTLIKLADVFKMSIDKLVGGN
jgi:transcriptional regulator with XRE-family HTH domain